MKLPTSLPALAAGAPVPFDQNPAAVYLASLADGPGRALMGSSAEPVASAAT